jgi:hypothetical protein
LGGFGTKGRQFHKMVCSSALSSAQKLGCPVSFF